MAQNIFFKADFGAVNGISNVNGHIITDMDHWFGFWYSLPLVSYREAPGELKKEEREKPALNTRRAQKNPIRAYQYNFFEFCPPKQSISFLVLPTTKARKWNEILFDSTCRNSGLIGDKYESQPKVNRWEWK